MPFVRTLHRFAVAENQDPTFSEALEQEQTRQQEEASRNDVDRQGMQAQGDPIVSTRLGSNSLSIQEYFIGDRRAPSTVSAEVNGERVEVIYREMLFYWEKKLRRITALRQLDAW